MGRLSFICLFLFLTFSSLSLSLSLSLSRSLSLPLSLSLSPIGVCLHHSGGKVHLVLSLLSGHIKSQHQSAQAHGPNYWLMFSTVMPCPLDRGYFNQKHVFKPVCIVKVNEMLLPFLLGYFMDFVCFKSAIENR